MKKEGRKMPCYKIRFDVFEHFVARSLQSIGCFAPRISLLVIVCFY